MPAASDAVATTSKLAWYWRRLRAMRPDEMLARVRVKLRQKADAKGPPDWSSLDIALSDFPKLPQPADAPDAVREALRRDANEILAGRWKAFGHLPMQVDDPPKWHFDHLVRRDFSSTQSAFTLDHRAQAGGGDIKIIWEPSRWNQLVRLAQAAFVLNDSKAAGTCVDWLVDWEKNNPAYRGLNWTSALETGLRLIQFTWIDALLTAAGFEQARLAQLRQTTLPAHFWYTWRHCSFGSSANNHLIGELAGLAVALARFPALASLRPDAKELHALFEREVLAQFAPDGGNREQALGYHLFSWEFCWQMEAALRHAGRTIAPEPAARLRAGATFFARFKMPGDVWDYGDSDNAFVTPFTLREENSAEEWRAWFADPSASPGIQYWQQAHQPPIAPTTIPDGWTLAADSGYAVHHSGSWQARVDASELGFLATAAHGHLDALHFSLWHQNTPILIDPGTGAYYADQQLRNHLASWEAHNGPHFSSASNIPQRFGAFLWGKPHPKPSLKLTNPDCVTAGSLIQGGRLERSILFHNGEWFIADEAHAGQGASESPSGEARVHWKFAPGTQLAKISDTAFQLSAGSLRLRIELDGWSVAAWGNPARPSAVAFTLADLGEPSLDTVCSPAFRRLATCPMLHLRAKIGSTCTTRFSLA